jgi:hypothetical protein
MIGIELERAEAERMWRRTARMDDRFDLVERALAALAGRGGRNRDDDSSDGRKK